MNENNINYTVKSRGEYYGKYNKYNCKKSPNI